MPIRILTVLCCAVFVAACGGFFTDEVVRDPDLETGAFYGLAATTIEAEPMSFSDLRGDVVLMVNTASECGYTDQYQGLQVLHERFAERGLRVIAMPSNDFGGQEPGSSAEIGAFCSDDYGVEFMLLEKDQVKAGDGQSPIYAYLGSATGKLPGWNFGKYLVGRNGEVLGYWDSRVEPLSDELVEAIKKALG